MPLIIFVAKPSVAVRRFAIAINEGRCERFFDNALAALPRTHPFEEIFIFPSCKHTKRTRALCARFTPPLRLRQDAPTAEQSTAHSITAHVEFCPRGVGTRPKRIKQLLQGEPSPKRALR